MTDTSDEVSNARSAAETAMIEAAAARSGVRRISDQTIRRVVDIAWRHQFELEDRRAAREEMRAAVAPEVGRRMAANDEA